MKSEQSRFADLIRRVRDCSLCSRMCLCKPVLSLSNGSLDSPVVFIAEAPGRLGADRFGIPLYGDQTGRNFQGLISNAGIDRQAIFITNAVLCNPRTTEGNNDTPTLSEIRNCSAYLKAILDIIRPEYLVPLGRTALTALNIIEPHQIRLSDSVGKLFLWDEYKVYPLFHPGPRAFIWRTRAQQSIDYKSFSRLLEKV